jgi:hypothetical protein
MSMSFYVIGFIVPDKIFTQIYTHFIHNFKRIYYHNVSPTEITSSCTRCSECGSVSSAMIVL